MEFQSHHHAIDYLSRRTADRGAADLSVDRWTIVNSIQKLSCNSHMHVTLAQKYMQFYTDVNRTESVY